MVSKLFLLLGVACLSAIVSGQLGQRGRGLRRPGRSGRPGLFGGLLSRRRGASHICEASGAAAIVTPDQFISNKYTPAEWGQIIDSIKLHNKAEWDRLQAYEEYYYPDAYYEYEKYENFECKDVCRHKRRRVEGALLEFEDPAPDGVGPPVKMTFDCYIVGNPNIFYTDCEGKRPDVHKKRYLSSSLQCMSDMVQFREVIMYCPNMAPQCRTRVLELPQSCSLNEIKCKLPKKKGVRTGPRGRRRFFG